MAAHLRHGRVQRSLSWPGTLQIYGELQGDLDLMPKRLRDLELTAHQDILLDLWSFPTCYGLLWDNGLEGALGPEQQGFIRQGIERSGCAFRIGLALEML